MHIGIIAKLNGEKKELSARIEKIDRTIILLRELDGPAELSEPAVPAKPKRVYKKRKVKSKTAGLGTNRYKGVKAENPYKDGRPRYSANIHIPATKKIKYLGTFDSEEKAAAAYNQAAADMAEQAENNHDRPTRRRTKKTEWICNRCGTAYQSKGVCGCGCNDMREVPV